MSSYGRLQAIAGNRDVRLLALVVAVELCLLGLYFTVTPAEMTELRYTLYPFVWINISIWVVRKTTSPRASRRHELFASTVAAAYFFVLCWLAGLVGFTLTGNPTELLGVTVGYGSPGWERVRVVTPLAHLTLIPFRVVGYLALSYLVYVTILEATVAAVSGALGFVACLSCGVPIITSLATGLFGASAGLTGSLYTHAVDISTAVFLLAVGLLYYWTGPGPASRQPGDDGGTETGQRIE
jgi:hypothetical protein